jgi:hypothetical protein
VKYGIPPHPANDLRQWKAGQARGEQRSVATFFRRIIVKGLMREIEEKKGRRARPHSLATLDKLEERLRGTALKYDEDHWVRKSLTVKRNTLINDVKAVQREKKRGSGKHTRFVDIEPG